VVSAELHAGRREHLDRPYPGGESWRSATDRIGRFFGDLALRWDGARVLLIGHVATRLGLERFLVGRDLAELISSEFVWQAGWDYVLKETRPHGPD
jgi:2,3-bisphosphoglycerate-dependent phosphoglycerate mutase